VHYPARRVKDVRANGSRVHALGGDPVALTPGGYAVAIGSLIEAVQYDESVWFPRGICPKLAKRRPGD
jgi:hypothetical protein